MTEPYTNTRPMPNQRRLKSWLCGIGCALVLTGSVFCISLASTIYQQTPPADRAELFQVTWRGITYDLRPSTAETVIILLVMVVGFFLGREIVRWLYKE